MRYFSAQYVFTGEGPPLQRAIIATTDDGTIVSVEDNSGKLEERHSIEFYNGIIVPGFVNCHCHIELSHLRDEIKGGDGLAKFLEAVTANRYKTGKNQSAAIAEADRQMAAEGVVACADICNTDASFELKQKSAIKYINLPEVFGIDPSKATRRIEEIEIVTGEAEKRDLLFYVVPHSVYSVSKSLFLLIKEKAKENKVSSIHFLESEDEEKFISEHTGPLMEAYGKILAPGSMMEPANDHISAVLDLVTLSGSLVLVHNTMIEKHHIEKLKRRENLWYCLCPNSNLFISKKLPPVSLLADEGCGIVIGTDSLSSNNKLSMLSEMVTIQQNFPGISLEEIVRWATINGAKALGEDSWAGSIVPGKKPGLVLINNCDLPGIRLLETSFATRLI